MLNDLAAIDAVRQLRNDKMIMYVWLITGLVTPELLAKWHYDGDLKLFQEHMKRTKGEC